MYKLDPKSVAVTVWIVCMMYLPSSFEAKHSGRKLHKKQWINEKLHAGI